jgi:hypothetical protein
MILQKDHGYELFCLEILSLSLIDENNLQVATHVMLGMVAHRFVMSIAALASVDDEAMLRALLVGIIF